MPIVIQQENRFIKTATKALPAARSPAGTTSIRMEQEMMIMRETDQWMAEYYRSKALSR